MAKVEVVVEEEAPEAERIPLLDLARKVLMAGIGAVALAQEEVEEFVAKLVERGEIAEKDGKKLVAEVMERSKQDAKKGQEQFDKRFEEVLARMNVPTKADLTTLSDKIDELTKHVDELKKAK